MKIITSASSPDEPLSCGDPSKYLELSACGLYDLRGTSSVFTCNRPVNACETYMLQILLSGQASHVIDGATHTLHAGQCILYKPNQPQCIKHYGKDNPSFMWLHFDGYGVADIVSNLQLEGIHSLTSTSTLKKLLMELVGEKRSLLPNKEYLCQSHLLYFLVTLSHKFEENSLRTFYSGKITPAINYMMENYAAHGLSNKDYAKMCILSESRFSHIFKEMIGTTPKKFVEQKRISAAKEMLSSSKLTIFEIASSVGYEDPYHFSRVFKKNVGVSPQTYRKQCGNSVVLHFTKNH